MIDVRLEPDPRVARAVQEQLTARLPEWFGRPEANRHYAAQAEILAAYVARLNGTPRGLLLLKRHGMRSAEIYWMAVDPAFHRHGIGRALLRTATAVLAEEGRELLFALTLGPDDPNPHYHETRAFYEREGFFLALREHGEDRSPMVWYVRLLSEGAR